LEIERPFKVKIDKNGLAFFANADTIIGCLAMISFNEEFE
jgi:hypothetical protein